MASILGYDGDLGYKPKYSNLAFELSGKKRPNPPNAALLAILDEAAHEALGPGATVTIYSGMEDEGNQHGSIRHKSGHAGDLRISDADGNLIKLNDPRAEKFALAAAARGAQGIGAGEGYMGDAFHIDTFPAAQRTSKMGPVWGEWAKQRRGALTGAMSSGTVPDMPAGAGGAGGAEAYFKGPVGSPQEGETLAFNDAQRRRLTGGAGGAEAFAFPGMEQDTVSRDSLLANMQMAATGGGMDMGSGFPSPLPGLEQPTVGNQMERKVIGALAEQVSRATGGPQRIPDAEPEQKEDTRVTRQGLADRYGMSKLFGDDTLEGGSADDTHLKDPLVVPAGVTTAEIMQTTPMVFQVTPDMVSDDLINKEFPSPEGAPKTSEVLGTLVKQAVDPSTYGLAKEDVPASMSETVKIARGGDDLNYPQEGKEVNRRHMAADMLEILSVGFGQMASGATLDLSGVLNNQGQRAAQRRAEAAARAAKASASGAVTQNTEQLIAKLKADGFDDLAVIAGLGPKGFDAAMNQYLDLKAAGDTALKTEQRREEVVAGLRSYGLDKAATQVADGTMELDSATRLYDKAVERDAFPSEGGNQNYDTMKPEDRAAVIRSVMPDVSDEAVNAISNDAVATRNAVQKALIDTKAESGEFQDPAKNRKLLGSTFDARTTELLANSPAAMTEYAKNLTEVEDEQGAQVVDNLTSMIEADNGEFEQYMAAMVPTLLPEQIAALKKTPGIAASYINLGQAGVSSRLSDMQEQVNKQAEIDTRGRVISQLGGTPDDIALYSNMENGLKEFASTREIDPDEIKAAQENEAVAARSRNLQAVTKMPKAEADILAQDIDTSAAALADFRSQAMEQQAAAAERRVLKGNQTSLLSQIARNVPKHPELSALQSVIATTPNPTQEQLNDWSAQVLETTGDRANFVSPLEIEVMQAALQLPPTDPTLALAREGNMTAIKQLQLDYSVNQEETTKARVSRRENESWLDYTQRVEQNNLKPFKAQLVKEFPQMGEMIKGANTQAQLDAIITMGTNKNKLPAKVAEIKALSENPELWKYAVDLARATSGTNPNLNPAQSQMLDAEVTSTMDRANSLREKEPFVNQMRMARDLAIEGDPDEGGVYTGNFKTPAYNLLSDVLGKDIADSLMNSDMSETAVTGRLIQAIQGASFGSAAADLSGVLSDVDVGYVMQSLPTITDSNLKRALIAQVAIRTQEAAQQSNALEREWLVNAGAEPKRLTDYAGKDAFIQSRMDSPDAIPTVDLTAPEADLIRRVESGELSGELDTKTVVRVVRMVNGERTYGYEYYKNLGAQQP